MPTAVEFSQEFYGGFGHEAVDELVEFLNRIDLGYRSELKELNEANFARFDDKLERRVAELENRIGDRIAGFERRLMRWLFVFWTTTMLAVLSMSITVILKL